MRTNPCSIRFAESADERARAIAYIARRFLNTYGTNPRIDETPPDLIIAVSNNEIVGTVALRFGFECTLPYEKHFFFESSAVPIHGYNARKSVYLTLLNSSYPEIGKLLWLAANLSALVQGCAYTSLTAKTYVIERISRNITGPCWYPIARNQIREKTINPSDFNYFFTGQAPLPWVGDIHDQIEKLRKLSGEICNREQACIEID